MNILNLLIKEKRVAGIEISDRIIRVAFFRRRATIDLHEAAGVGRLPKQELILIEEALNDGLVRGGAVIDKELLGKTIGDIWVKEKIEATYAIVSIPENNIYSHLFSFPKTLNETALADAVALTINFQLPVKKEDSYVGWERTQDPHAINEVLISAVPRTIANDYVEALRMGGIKILALEPHLASIARAIELEPGVATLLHKINDDGSATIFVLRDGSLHFTRTIPASFVKNENFLASEIERIKISFESDKKISIVVKPLAEAGLAAELLKYPELQALTREQHVKWLISLGAAVRGEMPEGQDTHISLLSVGTAEAYAFQKATTFITLMRNMIIGVSIFFVLAFVATYFFVFYLSHTATRTDSGILARPFSPDMLKNEALVKNVNSLTAASQVILSTTPSWNVLLEEINTRVIPGVLISNFTVTSVSDPILMVGTAKDRNTINLF